MCLCVFDGNNLERWLMNFVIQCYKRMNEGNFKQHRRLPQQQIHEAVAAAAKKKSSIKISKIFGMSRQNRGTNSSITIMIIIVSVCVCVLCKAAKRAQFLFLIFYWFNKLMAWHEWLPNNHAFLHRHSRTTVLFYGNWTKHTHVLF